MGSHILFLSENKIFTHLENCFCCCLAQNQLLFEKLAHLKSENIIVFVKPRNAFFLCNLDFLSIVFL